MTVAMVWRFGLIALPATVPKAGDLEDRTGRDLHLTGERRQDGGGTPEEPERDPEPRAAAPGGR
ncbi:hypothetical protein [Streptomyces erythrochromogenes]|uniref:hypothetical protein n=1 Tax=Streptomyces erythrochromogenes TaxID=285574 RepID=UPI00386A5213|nr:hypothetical protein OG489_35240 [Streptomyces erythrochromogenes]